MAHFQPGGRRALAAIAVLGLAAIVAACSDHYDDRDHSQSPPVAGGPNPPPVATDAFVTYLTQVVATQDDTGEPASIEGVAATAPETIEPLPLSGS
jgi:hypothetical protein